MKRVFASPWQRWLFQARQFVWPSMGWLRFLKWTIIHLSRMPDGEVSIARGFACGAAVSMLPILGLHFICSAIVAKLVRGSWIAALVGTSVGNPWTFPLIWAASYKLGVLVLPTESIDQATDLRTLNWHIFISDPSEILLPMFIGAIPLMLVIAPCTYLAVLFALRSYNRHRQKRRAKRLAKRLEKQMTVSSMTQADDKDCG